MDPLVKGLFSEFRRDHNLEGMADGDAFELFAAKLMLREDLLDQVELTDLLLDPSTPGLDIVLLDINGQIVWSSEEVEDLCSGLARIEATLHLIQAKTSPSIDTAQILNMKNVVRRLVEGNPPKPDIYRKLSGISEAFKTLFEHHASKLKQSPDLRLYYVAPANDVSIGDELVDQAKGDAVHELGKFTFLGNVEFTIAGSSAIVMAARSKSNSNEVDIILEKQVNLPKMPNIDQGILGVMSIDQLLKLIESDDGSLDERVFYDNVRGFKGENNVVNEQITATLSSADRALLPVLNNGVTVVATSYAPRPGDTITLTDYQIVNGCQTSHCIYLAKESIDGSLGDVFVPIRLVVTNDNDVATQIIRATNSQSVVDDSDLIALTEFQKKLEKYYQQDEMKTLLTYERRSGQLYSVDVTRTRVVTIREQMRAVAATFLDLPHLAGRYPKQLYDLVGDLIFSSGDQYSPYVASAFAAYRLESAFRTTLEPEFKPLRYHILTAYKRRLFPGSSFQLNNRKVVEQSKALVESLRQPDYVSKFRRTAKEILADTGGSMPSTDRLKRSPFTKEMISAIVRSEAI